MFKVGDRVKRSFNSTNFVPEGTLGTVVGHKPTGAMVNWDNGEHNCGGYDDREITLFTHTWKVGDEFEVDMIGGRVARGKITNLSPFATVTDEGYSWSWDNFTNFESSARPVAALFTYSPGDKIVATKEHARNLGLPKTYARAGDIGEFVRAGNSWDVIKFNGYEYNASQEYFTAYLAPAPPVLFCANPNCNEANEYGEPNLPGGGYACYSCKKYHSYMLTGK